MQHLLLSVRRLRVRNLSQCSQIPGSHSLPGLSRSEGVTVVLEGGQGFESLGALVGNRQRPHELSDADYDGVFTSSRRHEDSQMAVVSVVPSV